MDNFLDKRFFDKLNLENDIVGKIKEKDFKLNLKKINGLVKILNYQKNKKK